jgi:nucleoside 2-deoxyribosyltransferase
LIAIIIVLALVIREKKEPYTPVSNSSATTVYLAGSLFTLQEILGNDLLANAIEEKSNGRYKINVPQRLEEQSHFDIKKIRDQDLHSVFESDMILVNANGLELDSGTVVEYTVAKSLDKPAVLFRSDFRKFACGPTNLEYNLMVSSYPRTINLNVDFLGMYKAANNDGNKALAQIAIKIIEALDSAQSLKPTISADDQKALSRVLAHVYKI